MSQGPELAALLPDLGLGELVRQVGLRSLPFAALDCHLDSGAIRLANEKLQMAYLASLARRMERMAPRAASSRLRECYEEMVRASLLRLARARVDPRGPEHLAAASARSLEVDFATALVGQIVDIGCELSADELALLRICTEVEAMQAGGDEEDAGYRLGAAVAGAHRFADGGGRALQALQGMGLLEPGIDIGLDVDRPYLPACRLTAVGRLVLKLLEQVREEF